MSKRGKFFNESKKEFEEALNQSGYKNFELKYISEKQAPKQNGKRKIIWFNQPFNKDVSTNTGKVSKFNE